LILDFTLKLPAELCTLIVSFLDFDTLLVVPKVSRAWASLFYVDDLWKLRMSENNWKLKIPNHVVYLTEEEQSWYYWYKQRFELESRWNMGKVASHYLIGHEDSVYCLQFDDEKIITGSRDHTIKIWDLEQYQCIHTLKGHRGSVLCLKYNDQVIISGSSDHTVIVWSMQTKSMRRRLHVSISFFD
jgi:F-box and WD-40 domain protein 1/11